MADSTPKTLYCSSEGQFCCVIGCSYSSRKLYNLQNQPCFDHKPLLRLHCPCEAPYSFYRPKSDDDRREWLARLQLKKPPKFLTVCSFHFADKRPTIDNPYPELLLGHANWKKKTRRVLVRANRVAAPAEQKEPESTLTGRKRKATATSTTGDGTPSKMRQTGWLNLCTLHSFRN